MIESQVYTELVALRDHHVEMAKYHDGETNRAIQARDNHRLIAREYTTLIEKLVAE